MINASPHLRKRCFLVRVSKDVLASLDSLMD